MINISAFVLTVIIIGTDQIEVQADAIKQGQRVLVHDDLLVGTVLHNLTQPMRNAQ